MLGRFIVSLLSGIVVFFNLVIAEHTHFPNARLYDIHPPFRFATTAIIDNQYGIDWGAAAQALKDGLFFVSAATQIGQCGSAALFSETIYIPTSTVVKVRVEMRIASFTALSGLVGVGGATIQAVPVVNGQILEPIYLNSSPSESAIKSALNIFFTGVGLGIGQGLSIIDLIKLVGTVHDIHKVRNAIKQVQQALDTKPQVVYFKFQAPHAGWYRVGIGIEATTVGVGTSINVAMITGTVTKLVLNY